METVRLSMDFAMVIKNEKKKKKKKGDDNERSREKRYCPTATIACPSLNINPYRIIEQCIH
jgi:hypothetical protein